MQTMAAQDNANMLELISLILLVAEGAVLVPLAILYVTLLRRNVAIDRVKLYSIFLRIPRPTVIAQAKAEVRLIGDGGDEEEEEQPVSRCLERSKPISWFETLLCEDHQ